MPRHQILTRQIRDSAAAERMDSWYKFLVFKRIYIVVSTLAVIGLTGIGLTSPAVSQDTPEFNVDVVSLRPDQSSAESRLDVYTRISHAKLRFLNTADGFTASYQVSADIVELDEDGKRGNLVQSPIWDRTVRVANYADTQAEQMFDFTTQSLELDPGRYIVEVQIEDQSSSESYVNELSITVKDFSGGISVSDVLLLNDFDKDTNTIYPNVAPEIDSDIGPLQLFYELYGVPGTEVHVTRDIVLMNEPDEDEDSIPNASIVYSDSETRTIASRRNQHIVNLPTPDLQVGNYAAVVKVESLDGEILDMSQKRFSIQWNGLLAHINNLDEAIQQMAYIAKKRDIRHILEPESEAARFSRFKEYWDKRDPTPGTTRNEHMEEYYYRVSFANQKYSSLTDGWKTDRGQVVVLFGEPDVIEKHPYNFSVKPYEVWYYYTIGRRFIFVDNSGLGDYRLIRPVWDETTWLR